MTSQAVILVGGRGTRLGALTRDTPKPLVPVAGRPFLDYLLRELERAGIGEVLLLAGYLAGEFDTPVRDWRARRMAVHLVIEPEPMGTGGALIHAVDRLADRFLVLNGDTFFDINPLSLMASLGDDCDAVMALRKVDDAGRFGRVDFDGERVLRFREKTRDIGAGLINGGIYALSKAALRDLESGPFSLEADLFPRLARARRIRGILFDRPFIDIGIPDDLKRAQQLLPAWLRRSALFISDGHPVRATNTEGTVQHPDVEVWKHPVRLANDSGDLVVLVSDAWSDRDEHEGLETVNAGLRADAAHVDAVIRLGTATRTDGNSRPVAGPRQRIRERTGLEIDWTRSRVLAGGIGADELATTLGLTCWAPSDRTGPH